MAAAKKITAEQVADAFQLIADFYRGGGAAPAPASSGKVAGKSDASSEEVELLDEDEIRGMSIKELRELAIELGLEEQKLKGGILDELEAKGHFGEVEEEDAEADAEDEGDDEDDEAEGYTRDELEEMDLKQLRVIAKGEGVLTAAEIRKADADALIEAILGEDEEEDDEDEDGDEEVLDEDALKAMNLTELKDVANELGLKISPRIAKIKPKIVEFILANAAEEDE